MARGWPHLAISQKEYCKDTRVLSCLLDLRVGWLL